MAAVNTITVSGNLTADPELRQVAGEVPLARLRIAVNQRVRNKDTEEWEDRLDGFFDVVAWRDLARHAAACLRKGDRVTVTGRMLRRSYEADLGEGRTETRHRHEIEAEDLGPSLRWRSWARLELRVDEPGNPEGADQPPSGDSSATDVTRAA